MSVAPSKASAQTLARGVRALGAPVGAERLLLCGAPPALARALVAELEPRHTTSVRGVDEAEAPHDLIVAAQDLERGSVNAVRDRLAALAARLTRHGHLIIYPATLAAPVKLEKSEGEAGPFDSLLFPEAAAAGDMGDELAASSRLSASTWLLMARSMGLDLVAQAGQGEHVLPAALVADHEARLAVYDPVELTTGRLLLLLRAMA